MESLDTPESLDTLILLEINGRSEKYYIPYSHIKFSPFICARMELRDNLGEDGFTTFVLPAQTPPYVVQFIVDFLQTQHQHTPGTDIPLYTKLVPCNKWINGDICYTDEHNEWISRLFNAFINAHGFNHVGDVWVLADYLHLSGLCSVCLLVLAHVCIIRGIDELNRDPVFIEDRIVEQVYGEYNRQTCIPAGYTFRR